MNLFVNIFKPVYMHKLLSKIGGLELIRCVNPERDLDLKSTDKDTLFVSSDFNSSCISFCMRFSYFEDLIARNAIEDVTGFNYEAECYCINAFELVPTSDTESAYKKTSESLSKNSLIDQRRKNRLF